MNAVLLNFIFLNNLEKKLSVYTKILSSRTEQNSTLILIRNAT